MAATPDTPDLLKRIEALETQVARLETQLLLISDVYRYQALHDALAAGRWEEADRETVNAILAVTGQSNLEDITPETMRGFPCAALQVIDRLWQTYSQGRFGFGVQLRIYQEVGGDLESTIRQDNELIRKMGEQVGWWNGERWRKCDELTYSLEAPAGCHPSRWWNSPFGAKMTNYFFNRLLACNL
ncbi:MAG: GUN4 domain-containing protein [Gloeomargaritaceae cyanobacterium C42_A2020_066]|nr:GUN4 domain-containing protein [Gloeomargaritaceae cyanobacterium C42_A2020_066]